LFVQCTFQFKMFIFTSPSPPEFAVAAAGTGAAVPMATVGAAVVTAALADARQM